MYRQDVEQERKAGMDTLDKLILDTALAILLTTVTILTLSLGA